MEKFYAELASIFDVDSVNGDDLLEDFEEYDSLSILSIIHLFGTKYHKTIKANDVRKCLTVDDLYKFTVEEK